MANETFISGIRSQMSRNSVALISVLIAITSLGYNTWRNEHTEYNRNVRVAAFDVLFKLAELKELVYLGHYDHDQHKGNPRTGWSYVLTIGDLSAVLPDPLPNDATQLQKVWGDNWEGIGTDETSVDNIDAAIDIARDNTVQLIKSLH